MEQLPPQTDGNNQPICGGRKKECRSCGHRFTKAEHGLWYCPGCDEPRWCERVVKAGRKCPKHGGKSLTGPSHPNFKNGAYWLGLPPNLKDNAAAFYNDPDIVGVRSEISVVRSQIAEIWERVREYGGGDWAEVDKAWDKWERVAHKADATEDEKVAVTLNLKAVIKDGVGAEANQRQIDAKIDRIGRLVKVQADRESKLAQNMTEIQAMGFLAGIIAVVEGALINNVPDNELQQRIMADISAGCQSIVSRPALPGGGGTL